MVLVSAHFRNGVTAYARVHHLFARYLYIVVRTVPLIILLATLHKYVKVYERIGDLVSSEIVRWMNQCH